MSTVITRYHDISCGHRVVGHEGKCRFLHGHNYRIHFTCEAKELDSIGRVIDFSVVKEKLCMWLEDNWDHKFLVGSSDPMVSRGGLLNPCSPSVETLSILSGSIVPVPFNPTAENMAHHLVTVVGPQQLAGTGVQLRSVMIEETAKCSATYVKEKDNV